MMFNPFYVRSPTPTKDSAANKRSSSDSQREPISPNFKRGWKENKNVVKDRLTSDRTDSEKENEGSSITKWLNESLKKEQQQQEELMDHSSVRLPRKGRSILQSKFVAKDSQDDNQNAPSGKLQQLTLDGKKVKQTRNLRPRN